MAHRVTSNNLRRERLDLLESGGGGRQNKCLWIEIDTTIHGLTLMHIFHQVLLSFSFSHPLKLIHCLGVPPGIHFCKIIKKSLFLKSHGKFEVGVYDEA